MIMSTASGNIFFSNTTSLSPTSPSPDSSSLTDSWPPHNSAVSSGTLVPPTTASSSLRPSLSGNMTTKMSANPSITSTYTDKFGSIYRLCVGTVSPTSFYNYATATATGALPYPSSVPPCCGTCELSHGFVDVYYWPRPGANNSCSQQKNTITSQANRSRRGVRTTELSQPDGQSYAVGADGFT